MTLFLRPPIQSQAFVIDKDQIQTTKESWIAPGQIFWLDKE